MNHRVFHRVFLSIDRSENNYSLDSNYDLIRYQPTFSTMIFTNFLGYMIDKILTLQGQSSERYLPGTFVPRRDIFDK